MRIIITAIAAIAIAAGAAWYFELWDPSKIIESGGQPVVQTPPEHLPDPELGELLYKPAPDAPGPIVPSSTVFKADPLVIPSILVVYDKQKVPSPRDGILMFIGQEMKSEDPSKPGQYPTASIMQGDKELIVKAYKRWHEDDIVKPGEMLGLVNPALAMKEFQIKQAEMFIAKEEYSAAGASTKEAKTQYERILKASSVSTAEEISLKKLIWDKQIYDERTKFETVKAKKLEADKAEIVLDQHTIRNDTMKGTAVIKRLFRKDGESIKAYEDIMELHNIESLRAEGSIGSEYKKWVQKGKKVTVEPIEEDAPFRRLAGHTGEITAVAFGGRGSNPVLLSASADKTVRVWRMDATNPVQTWHHSHGVTVVACTPEKAEGDWCLSGCGDGSLRLWDLGKIGKKDADTPLWTKEVEGAAGITALAFSPDGKFFATGGEDNSIHIFDTKTSEHLYRIETRYGDMHQGTITSLHFTPQCRLVSAARDNTIRVWELYQHGAKLHLPPIENRSGTVSLLGVSKDGRWMLFDKGKELHVLSVADGNIKGFLPNPMGTSFESLALFSPDANTSLILTAGAPEGRLQLWKTPLEGARPFEVRQFVPKDRSSATCAAFAPGAGGFMPSLAATGCKDNYVYVWTVPGQAEVESQPIRNLTLDLVEQAIEGGTQFRIAVTVPNPVSAQFPKGKLSPGGTANIVVE